MNQLHHLKRWIELEKQEAKIADPSLDDRQLAMRLARLAVFERLISRESEDAVASFLGFIESNLMVVPGRDRSMRWLVTETEPRQYFETMQCIYQLGELSKQREKLLSNSWVLIGFGKTTLN